MLQCMYTALLCVYLVTCNPSQLHFLGPCCSLPTVKRLTVKMSSLSLAGHLAGHSTTSCANTGNRLHCQASFHGLLFCLVYCTQLHSAVIRFDIQVNKRVSALVSYRWGQLSVSRTGVCSAGQPVHCNNAVWLVVWQSRPSIPSYACMVVAIMADMVGSAKHTALTVTVL